MMNWDNINDMLKKGFEIGSHTRRHSNLFDISDDDDLLKDEILGSKQEIEDNTSQECKYIAWPFGAKRDINKKSLNLIKSVGYDSCFGAFRGTVNKETNFYTIPRHEMNLQIKNQYNQYFARGNMETELII